MSKKVQLNVRTDSNYGKATEFMRIKQVYTRTMLMSFFGSLGKNVAQASASTGVMLSPRLTSRGDCRGNASNPWGHVAYNEKLGRKTNKETGKKFEQKFRFRFRDEELPRKSRAPRKVKTAQEKVAAPMVAVKKTTNVTSAANEMTA